MMFHRIALMIVVCVIFSLGLVMIFNTTSAEILDHARISHISQGTHQALFKQMIYAAVGFCFAFAIWKWGYHNWIQFSPLILAFLSLLLILCFVPGIGKTINGSKRWIGWAGMTFQPSEFVKYSAPAFFIYRLRRYSQDTFSFKEFLKILALLSIPLILILIEPNNGTAGVIALLLAVVCLLANIPWKFWAVPLIALLALGSVTAYNLPYVRARFHAYLHPELDLKGKGHQPHQAKIAAGSGKLLGRGIGNSLQKLSYLPEAQSDYIAAIYAEETGFLGTIFLISAYLFIAYLGFAIAYRSSSVEGCCFAAVITFIITFQAFMNLGVVSGLLPSTGLNLPFFSQGGSSLMANMMGIGILLNISKMQKEDGM